MQSVTRITIVDHDVDLSELLTELFAIEGYETTTWSPAEEEVDALCTADADLILFDGWPDRQVKGWPLLRLLRRDPRTASTPIVICSGDEKALEDNAAWLRAEGIAALSKPFDLEDLFDTVEACLHDRRRSHVLASP